eukprot:m.13080 g.13080  ORF g.13080 m.13080 type:complete len:964 (-) comp3008_c0_seq1:193-3084(-)
MEGLEQTIVNFYNGDVAADRLLIEFQASDEAWIASLNLLSSETSQVAAFAANVLLQKCRAEAANMSDSSRDELTSTLLAKAGETTSQATGRVLYAAAAATTSSVCTDLAAFTSQLQRPYVAELAITPLALYLGALGDEITRRMERSGVEPSAALCSAVVPVLAAAAERSACDAEADTVLCAVAAWGAAGLTLHHLAASPLLGAVLQWATSPPLTPAAAKALTECADGSTRGGTAASLRDRRRVGGREVDNDGDDMAGCLRLAETLLPALAGLTPMYMAALEAEESEWCMTFAIMLCAVGRHLLPALAACRGTVYEPSVATLLEVVAHATGTTTSLAAASDMLAFWDDLAAAMVVDDFWGPLFAKVVEAVLAGCQYEADWDGWELSALDEGDFKRHRRIAAGVLRAAATALGPETMFDVMTARLSSEGTAASWQVVEVAFFSATAVADEVVPRPRVVRRGPPGGGRAGVITASALAPASAASPSLSPNVDAALTSFAALGFGGGMSGLHPQVRAAALGFAAAYVHWLLADPVRREQVLQVMVDAMADVDTVEVAAQAFRQVCASCGDLIASSMDVSALVAQVAQCTFPTPAAATAAEGLVRVVASCSNEAAIGHAQSLVLPIVESLQGLQRQGSGDSTDAAHEVAKELNVLGVVMRFLDQIPADNGPHAAVQIFGLLWETLQALALTFSESEEVVKELCGIFDAVIRAGKTSSREVLPVIFEALLSIIEQTVPEPYMFAPFTTSLEFHGQLAPPQSERDGVSETTDERQVVLGYFTKALDLAFDRLGLATPDFSRNAAAYGAYLDFTTRMVIFSPESIAQSQALPHVLDFSLACVGSGSRDALRAACPLLSRAARSNHGDVYLRVQQWLYTNAPNCVALLLDVVCVSGSLDTILKPSEVVFDVCEAVGLEHLDEMLGTAMQNDRLSGLSDEQRAQCISRLQHAAPQGKREFIQTLVEFGKACRL